MRSEVARGRSVLISSHLLDDLADLTNSFYFIEAGTLVEKIKSSSQTLSAQRSESETKSLVEGVTDTTNSTLSKAQSHGTSTSKTHTDTRGRKSEYRVAFGAGERRCQLQPFLWSNDGRKRINV